MVLSDWFKIPGTKWKFPWGIFWGVTSVLFMLPGLPLWLITLGGFRHWHLQKMWLDFCSNSQIERDGLWT